MQHYSAPTRILDWSCSPWVALYFACCEEEKADAALLIADFNKVVSEGENRIAKVVNDNATSNFIALSSEAEVS